MKQTLRSIYTIFALFLVINSGCEKEKFNVTSDERPEPTIVLSVDDASLQQPAETELYFTVTFEAQAGIRNIRILQGATEVESLDFTEGKVKYNYVIRELMDDRFEVGDKIDYQFSIEDNLGRTSMYSFQVEVTPPPPLDPTFTIVDRTINGEVFKAISGTINLDVELESTSNYILSGNVTVRSGSTLHIQPGTTIYGEALSTLVISIGATINASGTKEEPIVFTSINDLNGNGKLADWVGLHINGLAPVSGTASSLANEIGNYGGSNPADNSGKLQYVRVEFAGAALAGSSGALNFNGVGSGTTIDHINVHQADGHAIRFRGGSANLKYAFIDHADGRALRWESSYIGFVQHILAIYTSNPSSAVTLIEGYDPTSNPTLSNITLMSLGSSAYNNSRAIRLRDGTKGRIYNTLITNTVTGVRADDLSAEIASGSLFFGYSHLWNNSTRDYQNDATAFSTSAFNNKTSAVPLNGYIGTAAGGYAPKQLNAWFDDTSYIGAVPETDDWTANWTK